MLSLHSGAHWSCLCLVILCGCASAPPAPLPPTELPEARPGYVVGYLQAEQWVDSLALLPPPPAVGSAVFAADEAQYKSTRALSDSPRWLQANQDANLEFPKATEVYSCALAIPISAQATPHLNMLLRRVRADASRAVDKVKDKYKRKRPYAQYGESSCTPKEDARMKPDSYPSGHTSIGWAWALTLAEIAPDRSGAILARGLSFGESRMICGVHWNSDIEAGRVIGAATVSRLHADPVFVAQMALAKKEIDGARAAGLKPALDCAAEARVLAGSKSDSVGR
jgi:acid phosphatase (class A)